ncbi:MAG: hypothetical protein QXU75_06625 [Candidatus Methanomethylicaceae archaeon]
MKIIARGILTTTEKPLLFTRYEVDNANHEAARLLADGVEFEIIGDNIIEVYQEPQSRMKQTSIYLREDQIAWLKAHGEMAELLRELIDRAIVTENGLREVAERIGCNSIMEFLQNIVSGEIIVLFHPYDTEEIENAVQELRSLSVSGKLRNLIDGVANALINSAE